MPGPDPRWYRSPLLLLSAVGGAVAVVGVVVVVAVGSRPASPTVSTPTSTGATSPAPGPRALPAPSALRPCAAVGIARPPYPSARCRDRAGRTLTVVDRAGTLRLRTLDARLVGPPRIARRLSNRVSGLAATARGRFLLLTIEVHNRLASPQVFDPADGPAPRQTLLVLGPRAPAGAGGTEAFAAAQTLAHPLGAIPFAAGETDTGTLVYDVPAPALAALRHPGALLEIAEFGARPGAAASLGAIRLWR